MELEALVLFAAWELVLLLGGALFLLYRKYALLRRRLDEQPLPVAGQDAFDSIESGFLSYLEKEILATHARMEQFQSGADTDNDRAQPLQIRLTLLEVEKQVVESSNDYPDRHWEFVFECFKAAFEKPEPEQVPDISPDFVQHAEPDHPKSLPEVDERPGNLVPVEALQGNLQQQGVTLDSMRRVLQQVKRDPQAELLVLRQGCIDGFSATVVFRNTKSRRPEARRSAQAMAVVLVKRCNAVAEHHSGAQRVGLSASMAALRLLQRTLATRGETCLALNADRPTEPINTTLTEY